MTLPQNLACFKWKILSNAMAMWQADRDSKSIRPAYTISNPLSRKNLPRNFLLKRLHNDYSD